MGNWWAGLIFGFLCTNMTSSLSLLDNIISCRRLMTANGPVDGMDVSIASEQDDILLYLVGRK